MAAVFLLLISLCLLSGLSHGQNAAQVDAPQKKLPDNSEKRHELQSSTQFYKCSHNCCSSLYQIGQDVGALAEAQKSTFSKLEETTKRQEEAIKRLEETIKTLEESTRKQVETTRRLETSEAQLSALNNTLSTFLNKEKIQAAFSASFPLEGSQTAGTADVPVVYRIVQTNLGNAYSPVTAPVKGVYSFSFTSVYWYGSGISGGSLYHNRQKVVSWYRDNASYALSGSNSAVLMLNVGDKVSVYLWSGRTISDNVNKHSSFSRFLFYTSL